MPQNKDFYHRIEIIDECLRNRNRKWTLENLLEAVNTKLTDRYGKTAAKRTIQADIKYLVEEKNAPIDRKREGNTTWFSYIDNTFSIKNLPVKEDEKDLINDAIEILTQVNEFQILKDVKDVIKKLQNTVKATTEKTGSIIQFEKHTTSTGTQHIDNIFAAIKAKTALRIAYQSFKMEEPEHCVFHPYLLKEYRNRWFVIGRKDSTIKITNFALDRIKGIKTSAAHYIENDLFNPETYFNHLIGVTFPENEIPQEVEIKVKANQAPYIRTKPIHYSQEIIKEKANGDITIRLWLINNYELRSALLSYGCDLEILKPKSLQQSMIKAFQDGVNCYN